MKFKVGENVRTITNDKWNNHIGHVYEIAKSQVYSKGYYYYVEFEKNVIKAFDEDELLSASETQEEKSPIKNADIHKQILNEMHDTYKRKNADYGNSFEEQFKEYGLLSVLIRLDDKMRRLKQLSKNEAQVKDESLRDTLMDLCNYSVMSVMELDKVSKDIK
jgi:hypothetical protein